MECVGKIRTWMDAGVITMFYLVETKCCRPLFTRSQMISSSLKLTFPDFCEVWRMIDESVYQDCS